LIGLKVRLFAVLLCFLLCKNRTLIGLKAPNVGETSPKNTTCKNRTLIGLKVFFEHWNLEQQ